MEEKSDGPYYKLIVEGNNMRNVMAVPGINPRRTVSNNTVEVEKTLGIESARSVLCLLFTKYIIYFFQNCFVIFL